MPQQVEISSINFSGQSANIIFTPTGSDISYGLGVITIPFIFNSNSLGNNINIYGKYSISIVDSNCTHVLVIN